MYQVFLSDFHFRPDFQTQFFQADSADIGSDSARIFPHLGLSRRAKTGLSSWMDKTEKFLQITFRTVMRQWVCFGMTADADAYERDEAADVGDADDELVASASEWAEGKGCPHLWMRECRIWVAMTLMHSVGNVNIVLQQKQSYLNIKLTPLKSASPLIPSVSANARRPDIWSSYTFTSPEYMNVSRDTIEPKEAPGKTITG